MRYKAVVKTFLVVEQHLIVYKTSTPKCLYFITYFNRRLGTWLALTYIFCSRIAYSLALRVPSYYAYLASYTNR